MRSGLKPMLCLMLLWAAVAPAVADDDNVSFTRLGGRGWRLCEAPAN